jgi:hypothetical protein
MHEPITWKQIARHIATVTNKPISVTRCQQIAERSMQKIAEALSKDSQMRGLYDDHR